MARGSPTGRRKAGFTIAELLVVVLIVGLLATIAVPTITGAILRAEEAALRENLSVMRRALDDHFADRGEYPHSLEELVAHRYIRFVPDDPLIGEPQLWELVTDDAGGIVDVRSSSDDTASDGTPYSEW